VNNRPDQPAHQADISSRSGSVTFGGASGAEIPIITQRRTSSTVTIKSGYTLAIGGMIQTTVSDVETSVPLLGDIPLLGSLFTNESKSSDRRNLVIFITAKTLDPEGSTYRDVIPQQNLSEMGITENDIPGAAVDPANAELLERLQQARAAAERAEAEARLRMEIERANRAAEQNRDQARSRTYLLSE
jgi:type IV pilus assembly protein PilQ